MNLNQKIDKFYKKEIEESYAGLIKDKLLVLLASENDLPRTVVLTKNRTFESPTMTEETQTIRYHQITIPATARGEYKVMILPEMEKIEISHTFFPKNQDHECFLRFSIQKELFEDYTPIEKAPIEKAYLVEDFTNLLRKIKI